MIFSPDSNVLILVIANHHLLFQNTSAAMISGIIDVEPIVQANWETKALLAPHAFSWADNVGKCNRMDKSLHESWKRCHLCSGTAIGGE